MLSVERGQQEKSLQPNQRLHVSKKRRKSLVSKNLGYYIQHIEIIIYLLDLAFTVPIKSVEVKQ